MLTQQQLLGDLLEYGLNPKKKLMPSSTAGASNEVKKTGNGQAAKTGQPLAGAKHRSSKGKVHKRGRPKNNKRK